VNARDPLLTFEEAGELLGTGPGLPRRLVVEGLLDHLGDGDETRIPESALIAYAVRVPTPGADSATEITRNDAA